MVSKEVGIRLCSLFGMKNAYITVRPKTVKDENGNVIQSTNLIYLYPYPSQTEAFTQDDRIQTVFKLDSDGVIQKPLEIILKEEECTEEFWNLIQLIYTKKNKQSRRSRKNNDIEYRHKNLIANIKKELNKQKKVSLKDTQK